MMKHYKFFSFLCLVGISQIAMSAGNIEQYSTVNTTNIQNTDKALQQSQATEWGLSTDEWQRYEKLRNGERKFWSPDLDPLTTLGIEAKNDVERKKYARLLAKKEFERAEKELAFQRAYDEAFKELYGNIPIIKSDNRKREERITFFTRTKNCQTCDSKFEQLLSMNKPVDIYFINSSDNEIRAWATQHNIDINKVRAKEITLNHDNGNWIKYGNGKIPIAFKNSDGLWEQIY